MSVINDVLQEIVDLCNSQHPYNQEALYAQGFKMFDVNKNPIYVPSDGTVVKIGSLPADNGISVFIGTGYANETFMDKGMAYELHVVLNGKHGSQQMVSDTLNDLHRYLTQLKDYPSDNDYQITDISTISAPNFIGREENKQYLYGSSLRVKFYLRSAQNA